MISIEMSTSDSSYYTQPLIFELHGDLDQEALVQALQIITNRHEALRTQFITSTSAPRQVVLAPGQCHVPLRLVQHPDANQVRSLPGEIWFLGQNSGTFQMPAG